MQNMILYVNEIGTKMLNFYPKLEDCFIILKKVQALGPDLWSFRNLIDTHSEGKNFSPRTELFAASTISVVDGKIIIRWCNDYDSVIMVGQIRLYMQRIYYLKQLMTTQILF